MSETETQPESQVESKAPSRDLQTLPPFDARRFRMRRYVDAALRLGVVVLITLALMMVWLMPNVGSVATIAVVAMLVGVWVWAGQVNAQVSGRLDAVLLLLEQDTPAAEDLLAILMKRRGLMRWVRLMLYQRLAMLRHRQGRYAEAAQIAGHVLREPLGPAEGARGNLLLLLIEANLKIKNYIEAYAALSAIAPMRLPLIEQLQRLALQTQYETELGYDEYAIAELDQKIAFAELLPAHQCGTWHATVAGAAERTGRTELADWLKRRAELLISETQPSSS